MLVLACVWLREVAQRMASAGSASGDAMQLDLEAVDPYGDERAHLIDTITKVAFHSILFPFAVT